VKLKNELIARLRVFVFALLLQNSLSFAEQSLLPEKSGFRLLDTRQFGFGTFADTPTNRTANRYKRESLGFSISYDQLVRRNWSGGLSVRMGSWEPTEKGRTLLQDADRPADLASVWSLASRVQWSPNATHWISPHIHNFFRPFGVFGLGFASFFDGRNLGSRRNKNERSEPDVHFGVGVRLVWPQNAALRISYEKWRTLRSFDYTADVWALEVQFGDVDAI
jgi:hypothetical protein